MFLAVIVPLSVLGMVLPNFTVSASGPTFSPLHATFLIIMSAGALWRVSRGPDLESPGRISSRPMTPVIRTATAPLDTGKTRLGRLRITPRCSLLYLLPMVVLSKQFAVPVDHAIGVTQAPPRSADCSCR